MTDLENITRIIRMMPVNDGRLVATLGTEAESQPASSRGRPLWGRRHTDGTLPWRAASGACPARQGVRSEEAGGRRQEAGGMRQDGQEGQEAVMKFLFTWLHVREMFLPKGTCSSSWASLVTTRPSAESSWGWTIEMGLDSREESWGAS